MWSYYGSKSKIIKHYPEPKYGKIVEPFAGSARYALRFWERDVDLYDIDENVITLWKWLQTCSPQDILGLPKFKAGDRVSNYTLSDEEKLFCGFLVVKGAAKPQDKATSFCTSLQPTWIPTQLNRIAGDLHKIKHWGIHYGGYSSIQNQQATWFVDPPYQFGGEHYKHNNKCINYTELAEWCQSRDGHIIVCENDKAGWLPFEPLIKMQGLKKSANEMIWEKNDSIFTENA